MLNCLAVALSSLLFENIFHCAFGVLDDGGLNFYCLRGNGGVAAKGVVARAELVNGVQRKHVADLDVAKVGHGKQVAGRQNVLATGKLCNDIF